ncbi:HAD-IIA family hydrolase [Kineococcus gynurae]|uniref:HAD-IIA family hydrolase n=1 Tax=Kineococcus gynurae TaxID=452979 RepID=A0ABV5LP94_9ACTN
MTAPTGTAPEAGARVDVQPDRWYRGYVFDLDGTVYLGDEPLPRAAETIAALRAAGSRTVFLSNNPTKDPAMYAEKLSRLGIPTAVEEILNPLVTMSAWLLENAPGAGVFVIGEEPLRRHLRERGIRLVEEAAETDVVVASFDRTFDYRKLQTAFDALWFHRRARLVTTNPDRFCPMPGGRGEPDAAAVVAAIEACTGVTCEMNAGKPGTVMLDAVRDLLGLPVEDCVLVGDRLATDIAMARAAGMASALVLTGENTAGEAAALPADQRPTWVLEGIGALLPGSQPSGAAGAEA